MPVEGILVNSAKLQKPYELEICVTIVFSLTDKSANLRLHNGVCAIIQFFSGLYVLYF